MARQIGKLSALGVAKLKKAGYHGDGAGLWLQVSPSGSKSWVFRFTLAKKAREMGLGSFRTFSLEEARDRARVARQLLADGVDPIVAKEQTKLARAMEAARQVTFRADAEAYIEAHRDDWKNAKHAWQWQSSLETYAFPKLGDMIVGDIEASDVAACLKPIWATKTETATRVRGRIEKVLDYSKSKKHRTGDNPAEWKGNLENLLGKSNRNAKIEHHPAVPYAEVAAFMLRLRKVEGQSARALEFAILTATRSIETRGALWNEIDLERAVWTIPGERMKMKKKHRVPLSKAALSLLRSLPAGEGDELVFPSPRGGMLSDMSLVAVMRRMGMSEVPHGFRSTFRDWAAETTTFPQHVLEMALAHSIGDKVEAAYRRGDLFEKRTPLMQAWSDYCARSPATANVTPIRKAAR